MDHDQLVEHLIFARELGVAGVSRDRTWRARKAQEMAREEALPVAAVAEPAPTVAHPVAFSSNAADALAAVRTDIGD